jgi:hypothetical protein
VADSNDKRRARLNIIRHLLEHVPYERVPLEHVSLPKRPSPKDVPSEHPWRRVPEHF